MTRFIRVTGPLLILLAVAFLFTQSTHATSSARRPAADQSPLPEPDMADSPRIPLLPPTAEAAEPPPAVPNWAPLAANVHDLAHSFPGRLSVVAVDLTSGARYQYRAGETYLPASTVKVAVALCYEQAIARGQYRWETPVAYTEPDYDPDEPTGMDLAPFGTTYTIRELVDNALIYSSNVALRMLTRTLTSDAMSDCTGKMGGPVTRGPEGSTPVTADDVAAWWLTLWQLHTEAPARAEELLRPLRAVEYQGRIMAGTPRPDLVTHKYGSVDGFFHDGAIVWADRPYVLVVMTDGAATEEQADETIAGVAAAAWAALEPGDAGNRVGAALSSDAPSSNRTCDFLASGFRRS